MDDAARQAQAQGVAQTRGNGSGGEGKGWCGGCAGGACRLHYFRRFPQLSALTCAHVAPTRLRGAASFRNWDGGRDGGRGLRRRRSE